MKIEVINTADLIPYARNSRTHSDAQVAQIAGSIREFGFTNPVLIDAENGIIAGHGRVLAAGKLGLAEVPCIRLAHLTETQKRAYIIADNKLALNAGWDEEMLGLELADLREADFDLGLLGFDAEQIEAALNPEKPGECDEVADDTYTNKIKAPIYEAKGEKPEISEMIDREKTDRLIKEIKESNLPTELARFLIDAAERHTVFKFRQIAEYYCHASAEVQDLFEKSGLVIIDFNKAIEYGFVHLTERLGALADMEQEAEGGEDEE
jgi:hypothetical protein